MIEQRQALKPPYEEENAKLQHWRGFPGENARRNAPNGDLRFLEQWGNDECIDPTAETEQLETPRGMIRETTQ
ncbi:MAG: hypothetical protein ABL931_21630 [Usitatibacteraceae bacterium]